MTVENKHLHIVTWLIQLISTLIYVFIVYSIYLTRFYEKVTPGIPKDYYTLFFGIVYVGMVLYPTILKLYYVYYSDDGDTLVIKTYPIGFFVSGKKTYRIPKKDFIRAEIRETFFGLRKALILYQKVNNKTAKYPPVYINGLPEEDRQRMLISLSGLMSSKTTVLQQS